MRRTRMLCRIAAILALSIGWACAQVRIPDTPAGQTLRAWLDAFNSGEPARVDKFEQRYASKRNTDLTMDFRDRTGRLELLSVEKADRTHLEFRVKQLAGSRIATGELEVTDATPAQIVKSNFAGLQDIAPGKSR